MTQQGITGEIKQTTTKEQLTEDVWTFSDIPEGQNRLDLCVPLILPKRYYERFLAMLQGDADLVREVFSTLLCDKLEQWAGEHNQEPEVTRDFVQAAINKHMPLPERKQRED